MRRIAIVFTVGALACGACELGPGATPAAASVQGTICGVAGFLSGLAGKACSVVTKPGSLLSTGKKLLGGLLGAGGSTAAKVAGFAALAVWVMGGAKFAVDGVMKVLGESTEPDLRTTWFSGTYWRIVGIAALLTLPFLFAAAIQALLHSDLAMLLRAAFGYLPLAMLAIAIAAPVTMLLLSASDEMSSLVTSAAGGGGGLGLLTKLGLFRFSVSAPFFAFLIGALAAAGAIVLWVELVVREAAVYVIVLMLPLMFAAMVWPARRLWATRSVELLIALILSKFAIVAVLVLGGAAVSQGIGGVTASIAGVAMLLMAVFAPWAMLRLLPFSEIAGAAAGAFGQHARAGARSLASDESQTGQAASAMQDAVDAVTTRLRRDAEQVDGAAPGDPVAPGEGPAGPGRRGAPETPATGAGGVNGGVDTGVAGVAARAATNGAAPSAQAPATHGAAPSTHADASAGGRDGDHGTAPDERLPGFDSIWQMRNGEWRPLFDDEGELQTPEPPSEPEPPPGPERRPEDDPL